MLRWLWPFGRRDDGRLIFRYRDGSSRRAADPVAVEQSLLKSLGRDWLEDVRSLNKPVPKGVVGEQLDDLETKREETRERVLVAVCVAFGVTRFADLKDGRTDGLTETELFDLLGGYLRFCNALRELARPFATARSRASPSTGSRPTASGSVPTSTATASPEPATTT